MFTVHTPMQHQQLMILEKIFIADDIDNFIGVVKHVELKVKCLTHGTSVTQKGTLRWNITDEFGINKTIYSE